MKLPHASRSVDSSLPGLGRWTQGESFWLFLVTVVSLLLVSPLAGAPPYLAAAVLILLWILGCLISPVLALMSVVGFVVSPVALYLTRFQTTAVVLVGISGVLLASAMTGAEKASSNAWREILRAATVFLVYMAANCLLSILQGNKWHLAFGELIPVLETYACFWLATRLVSTEKSARTLLASVLILVAIRAALQLVLFVLGKSDALIPLIYDPSEQANAEYFAEGLSFVRPIDPVAGLHACIAFTLFLVLPPGKLRRFAIVTAGVTSAVSILGLFRSEWIASFVCMAVVLYITRDRLKGLRKSLLSALAVLIAAFALLWFVFARQSIQLGDLLSNRIFDYTEQQAFDPQNSLQALRILELSTVSDAFRSAPIFRHGLGSGFGTMVSAGGSEEFVIFHNFYFNLLADAGLVGVILLFLLAEKVIRLLLSLYASAESPLTRGLLLISVVGLLWQAIYSGFEPILLAYHIPILLGVYLGCAVSLSIKDQERPAAAFRIPNRLRT